MQATAYPGYIFDHWESSNWNHIWFSNNYSPTAQMAVAGSGTATAVFLPATTHSVTFAFSNPWDVDGQLEIQVDNGGGWYSSLNGNTYTLTEGWHTVTYPTQLAWFVINGMYQDGTQMSSASFYVGADTTIVATYDF